VHFGTRFFEQRRQVRKLFDEGIVDHEELCGPRIVLGDFNEWIRGSVSPTLTRHLDRAHLPLRRRSRTFPSRLPLFRLDRIYFDPPLRLASVRRYKSGAAMLASDHLPLIADLAVPPAPGSDASPGTDVQASAP
jgi:endonuclease/exonuclease/phosphatase family metal-dependent hydrolase